MSAATHSTKLSAFVLMPFEAGLDDVYRELISAPLEAAGFTVRRADSLLNQRNILADVVTGIADADLVIADVTGLNPNVMYELGLAHALGKRTVMITQDISSLPFDLRPYRANEYSTNFKRASELADLLRNVGEAVANGTADFSNPVQDYAPMALRSATQVEQAPRQSATSEAVVPDFRSDGDLEPIPETLGLIDALEQLNSSAEDLHSTSSLIAARTSEVGSKFVAGTDRLDQIRKNLGDGRGLQPSKVVMVEMAKELETYSNELAPLNADLRKNLEEAVSAANVLARVRAGMDSGDPLVLKGELDSISKLGETLVDSYVSTSSFATQLAAMPQMQSDLTRASRRAASVVNETASILEEAQADFYRVESVLRERADRA